MVFAACPYSGGEAVTRVPPPLFPVVIMILSQLPKPTCFISIKLFFYVGRSSLSELVRRIKTVIFRVKPSPDYPDGGILQSLQTRDQEERTRRKLDRLIVKKAILFIVIMSCCAVLAIMPIVVSLNLLQERIQYLFQ